MTTIATIPADPVALSVLVDAPGHTSTAFIPGNPAALVARLPFRRIAGSGRGFSSRFNARFKKRT